MYQLHNDWPQLARRSLFNLLPLHCDPWRRNDVSSGQQGGSFGEMFLPVGMQQMFLAKKLLG